MVHDMVNRLTDDPVLLTFFTMYLMADSKKEKDRLLKRFWQDADALNETERIALQAAFTRSFKQMLPLTNQLYDKALAVKNQSGLPA